MAGYYIAACLGLFVVGSLAVFAVVLIRAALAEQEGR